MRQLISVLVVAVFAFAFGLCTGNCEASKKYAAKIREEQYLVTYYHDLSQFYADAICLVCDHNIPDSEKPGRLEAYRSAWRTKYPTQ